MHVHVYSGQGEAKLWLQPNVSLAQRYSLSDKEVGELQRIVEDRRDEIEKSWRKHFRD